MIRDDSGAVAIIVALFAVVLFGFAALVVDVGNASDVRAQASAAGDTGALAGENELADWTATHPTAQPDSAEQDAIASAVALAIAATYPLTSLDWATCLDDSTPANFVALSPTPCVQYQITRDAHGVVTGTQVRVRVPVRKVETTFGGLFGTSSISVSPVSAAGAGQNPASPCQPCDPRLDDATGEPVSQASLPTTPTDIRSELPYPADIGPAAMNPPNDPMAPDCPAGPGLFTDQAVVVDAATGCALPGGLYVFNGNSRLDVRGPLTTATSEGVTLVFYDNSTITVDPGGSVNLTAPVWSALPVTDEPIPGVAIVIDQSPASTQPPQARTFSLGAAFDITGSVYALDGSTVWRVADGDCPSNGSCYLHDDGAPAAIAVTTTSFPTVSGTSNVPTVGSEHEAPLPPPSAEHLTE